MNVLLPDPQMAPSEQAHEVVSLVDHASGAAVGLNQDDYLHHLALLAIADGRMDFGDLLALSHDPHALADAAMQSPAPEVRLFFQERRLSAASLQGVQARLRRLLRLPTVKEMLCARSCISFSELLERRLLVADLGSPPYGSEDIGRFVSGLVSLKFARAVFQRTAADVRRPVQVYIDEFQEGIVGTGAHVADNFERMLTMSRSRGVGLTLITQTFDRIARVAPTLPRVILANVNFQMIFRSTHNDAKQVEYLLPVTGRRPKPAPAPWERREGSPWMSRSEELAALAEELTRLPTRQFYFYNRELPSPAQLVQAPALEVRPSRWPQHRGNRHREPTARLPAGPPPAPPPNPAPPPAPQRLEGSRRPRPRRR